MRDEVHLWRSGRNGDAVHFDFHLLRDNNVRQARVVRPRRDVSRSPAVGYQRVRHRRPDGR